VLPFFLGRLGVETRYLWLVLPFFVLFSAAWMVWKMNVSAEQDGGALVDVMTASFCVVKILEYSLRGVLTEMVSNAWVQTYQSRGLIVSNIKRSTMRKTN